MSDEYDNYEIRKFQNSCPDFGSNSDIVYVSKPCPKCADKDAEIAAISKYYSVVLNSATAVFDEKDREIARLKSEIAKINNWREKLTSERRRKSDIISEYESLCTQLKAKLETARKALNLITDGTVGMTCRIAQEALKQIGE